MYCLVSLISCTLTFLSVFDFCHSSSTFVCAFSYFTQELLPVILIEVSQKISPSNFIIFNQLCSISLQIVFSKFWPLAFITASFFGHPFLLMMLHFVTVLRITDLFVFCHYLNSLSSFWVSVTTYFLTHYMLCLQYYLSEYLANTQVAS